MPSKAYSKSMPEIAHITELFEREDACYTNGMEQHQENMLVLQEMLSVLRERQSAWDLTAKEKERSKKGIEALEAAAAALSIQIYA